MAAVSTAADSCLEGITMTDHATEQNLELIQGLMTSNDELAQILQDIHTLCDQYEFKPEIFIDFIGQGKTRQFMRYHRGYHQKPRSSH